MIIKKIKMIFFSGKVIGDPYFKLEYSRIRALGGSSQHWGGACKPWIELTLKIGL